MNFIASLRAGKCRVAATAIAMLAAPLVQAQTDVAVFHNGDRLTGEIKFLDRGIVSFKTDSAGTLNIQWDDIAQLMSEQSFEVTLDDGSRLYGSLQDGAATSQLNLQTNSTAIELPMISVVRMTPIEGRLIERIDMSIDLGYSIAKANKVEQSTIGYDFKYRGPDRQVSLSVDTATSTSSDQPTSTRVNATGTYRSFVEGRKWDPIGLVQLERNDQLGIKQRSTVGGGVSRWLKDTNRNRISYSTGLAYSTEETLDSTQNAESYEGFLGLSAEWFRYDHPEMDVSTTLSVFPRLTGERRTRGNLDVNLRWELIKDFFWGFSIYYSFDDQPEAIDASTTDYGAVTSLGWKF
jgi:hypothetical protein